MMSGDSPPPRAAPRETPGRLLMPKRAQDPSEAAMRVCVRDARGARQFLEDVQPLPFEDETGLALLLDEATGNAYDVRLRLTREALTVQRQDVVCVGRRGRASNRRTVMLHRQPVGGLGLSVKGGAEHRVPVVISKISKHQAADRTGMLFVGDAVLQVNGISVEAATHEEVVHLLRNASDKVTITVEYLREAPSFLRLPLGSPGPPSDHGSRASSPLFDSGLHLNGNTSHTAPSPPSSAVADEPKYEKRWLDTLSVPLSVARISRSHAFEVLAHGVRSGALQFSSAREGADWLYAVAANISDLTLQKMKTANQCCSPGDQVVHMGWVNERLEDAHRSLTFRPRFLALRGPWVCVFSAPPGSTLEWGQAEKTYHLCEVLFKVDKFWPTDDRWPQGNRYLGPHDVDSEEDQRPHSFSITAGHSRSHAFTVELRSELAAWKQAFQRATFMEVQRSGGGFPRLVPVFQSRTYACGWPGAALRFTVDLAVGFSCFDSRTQTVLWRFKFSQLKGSSDDGKARVKLLFQDLNTRQIEMKELEFQDVMAVLHCIHAFLAAKVAALDPVPVDCQSVTRKHLHSH